MSAKGFQPKKKPPKGSGSRRNRNPKPREDAESGYSKAYAQLLGVLSEGEIEGPIDGLKGVYLNETPLQNADGSFNFNGVGYQFRAGTSDQSPIPGFGDDIASPETVGSEVKFNLPITRQIINPNLDLIRVRLAFQLQEFPPDGGYRRLQIAFRILIREGLGGFVVRHEQTIEARFSSPVELEYDFAVNNQGGSVSDFAVRVERVTPQDTDTTRYQRSMVFRSYDEIISTRLSYPYSALVGLQFDAEQFDSLPQAAFKIGGRLIRIPSNATVNRDRGLDYVGAWDGTFVTAPIACACPAWIFYDLVINKRYGLGKYIDASKVDKWSIYELSKYCNEMISTGSSNSSSVERRFQCHVLLTDKEDALKVIDALRSIFRGFTYWMNGALHLAADRPGTPAMIVTQADIVDGMFSYTRTPLRQRHTIAQVTWLDPENFYKRAIETVEDAIGIERYGMRELEMSAFGCISRSQAYRAGWAAIISERLELETVRFRMRPYGAYAVPGTIIKIMDIKRSIVRFGGLVVLASNRRVWLDHPVTLTLNDAFDNEYYLLTLTLPDGSIKECRVEIPSDEAPTDNLALLEPLSDDEIPMLESPWILSSVSVKPALYRVIGIVPVTDEGGLLYEISALEYRHDKYNTIDSDYYVPPQPPRPQIPPVPPAPINLTASIDDQFSATSMILNATWEAAPSDYVIGYIAQYRTEGGEWQGTQQVQFTSASWDVDDRAYWVRVAAIHFDSSTSNWVEFGAVRAAHRINLRLGINASLTTLDRLDSVYSMTGSNNARLAPMDANGNFLPVIDLATFSEIGNQLVVANYHPGLSSSYLQLIPNQSIVIPAGQTLQLAITIRAETTYIPTAQEQFDLMFELPDDPSWRPEYSLRADLIRVGDPNSIVSAVFGYDPSADVLPDNAELEVLQINGFGAYSERDDLALPGADEISLVFILEGLSQRVGRCPWKQRYTIEYTIAFV